MTAETSCLRSAGAKYEDALKGWTNRRSGTSLLVSLATELLGQGMACFPPRSLDQLNALDERIGRGHEPNTMAIREGALRRAKQAAAPHPLRARQCGIRARGGIAIQCPGKG